MATRLEPTPSRGVDMSFRMDRRAYAEHYGPTVGDRVRLAERALLLVMEWD